MIREVRRALTTSRLKEPVVSDETHKFEWLRMVGTEASYGRDSALLSALEGASAEAGEGEGETY